MILVLTPLAIEIGALRSALGVAKRTQRIEDIEVTTHEGLESKSGSAATSEIALQSPITCAIGGHGKVRFALVSQFLARELKPSLIVCAGACGALTPDLKIGDIVVAEKTVEHDFHLKFVKRPPPLFASDAGALERLVGIPGVHFGVIASGDEDIVERERADELRKKFGAIAVAWEGAGLARAAEFCGIPHIEIRVVTDECNSHTPKDFKKHVDAGMASIAKLLKLM